MLGTFAGLITKLTISFILPLAANLAGVQIAREQEKPSYQEDKPRPCEPAGQAGKAQTAREVRLVELASRAHPMPPLLLGCLLPRQTFDGEAGLLQSQILVKDLAPRSPHPDKKARFARAMPLQAAD
jgi:hypothetical protein